MLSRPHSATRAVFSLVLVALVAASCGGGASITTATGGTAAPAAAGSTTPAGASPAAPASTGTTTAGGGPVNVCALLPLAQVASITGQSLTQGTENDTPAVKRYGCFYAATSSAGVSVTIDRDAAATFGTLMQEALTLGGEPVSGLGDKAYHAVLGVNALFGDTAIFVSTDITASSLEPDAAAIALIKALQPKL